MRPQSANLPSIERFLHVIALLGRAGRADFCALLEEEPSGSEQAALAEHPDLHAQNGGWTMDADTAAAHLAGLAQRDGALHRTLHERAVTHLGRQLQAPPSAPERSRLESTFTQVFVRIASQLLQDDPARFVELVAQAEETPLTSSTARQWRTYFLGVAQAKKGRYDAALRTLDDLLHGAEAETQRVPRMEPALRGRALNSRAIYCQILGRLDEAVAGYQESLALWQETGNPTRQGMARLNLGILAYQLQDYAQAETHLTQAADCFAQTGATPWLASVQNELGLVQRDQGRWEAALEYFEAVAAQRREEGAQDSLGAALNNIGEVLLLQGRLDEAAQMLHRAQTAMTTPLYQIDVMLNLGLVRQAQDDYPAAYEAYCDALERAHTIGRRDILAQIHYRLGDVLRRLDRRNPALAQFEAAAQVVESTRQPLRDEGLRISLLGRWQQVYEALVLHCLELDRPEAAFQWAERARARAFAEARYQRAEAAPDTAPDSVLTDVAPIVTLSQLQQQLAENDVLLSYFTTGVLDRDAPFLRTLAANNPLRPHLLTPPRTLLFRITRAGLDVHECAFDPNAFASLSPRQGDRERFLAPRMRQRLYTMLLPGEEPGRDEPDDDTSGDAASRGQAAPDRHLCIIPHGPLHNVPFAPLCNEAGKPLIDADGPHLIFSPSATIFGRHQDVAGERADTQGCLAMGYDGGKARQLRYTTHEAQRIAELTGGEAWSAQPQILLRLRTAASTRRWLHFACHGWFDPDAPLDSYLAVGPDARLTARDILETWRLQAELVTLSACQTGVSRILRSDEPMGLIRGFLYAGARAVLASQWPVDDAATFLLMQEFYRTLVNGAEPAAALHTAQIWLRELNREETHQLVTELTEGGEPVTLPEGERPYTHPRYWAGFALYVG